MARISTLTMDHISKETMADLFASCRSGEPLVGGIEFRMWPKADDASVQWDQTPTEDVEIAAFRVKCEVKGETTEEEDEDKHGKHRGKHQGKHHEKGKHHQKGEHPRKGSNEPQEDSNDE